MYQTHTHPRVYWRRLLWGMYLEPKTWQSSYQTERGYHRVCRWDWRLRVLWRGSQEAAITGYFYFEFLWPEWFELLQESLDDATDAWGIKVERVEIKDVKLPQQLQRAMAAEAEASREARAKVKNGTAQETRLLREQLPTSDCACLFQIIAAEGEMKASRALKEASLVIAESPSALQLRYLQSLNSIAAEKNSTIIFPLPIDMLQAFMPKK